MLAGAPLDYWRLGESSGTSVSDAGSNALTGTYVGGVTPGVPGVGGADTAASFDGTSGYVDVPGVANASFSSGFTIDAWVKSATAQTDAGIVGKWTYPFGGVLLWLDGSGNYTLAVTAHRANYLTTSVAPTIGAWEHVVGTWDGAMLRLYVDGNEIGSQAFTGAPGLPTNDLQIGDYAESNRYFEGAVDEVALYDHALTADEIAAQHLGCSDIAGAADPNYVPSASDVDSTIRVVVSATNAAGERSAASELTAPVTAAPPPGGDPTDERNSAHDCRNSPRRRDVDLHRGDLDGDAAAHVRVPVAALQRRWADVQRHPRRNGRHVHAGLSDVGGTVRVVVTTAGASNGATSDPSPVVAAAPPANTSLPTLDTPTEGEAITPTPGTWTGTAPLAYAYTWQLCGDDGACTDIDGVTGSTYIPVAGDVGRRLRVTVHASNGAGEASAATTMSTPVVLGSGFASAQLWPYASGVAGYWPKASSGEDRPPTIAIIDSGIDASRTDFGGRVVQEVTLTTRTPNSPGDGRGHGTFVASVAAGQAHDHTGAAPNANIVSLDVIDDAGAAR